MKIAVLGATGYVGSKFVDVAHKNGYKIKALVRNELKIRKISQMVDEVVLGDALDESKVKELISGTDAVVCFLGHNRKTPKNLQKEALINILMAMSLNNVHRLVVMTGSAVLFPNDKPNILDFFFLLLMKVFARKRLLDASNMCKIIAQSEVDWTVVRCPFVNNFKSENSPVIQESLSSKIILTVSVYKVANFICNELRNNKFIRKAPVLSDF